MRSGIGILGLVIVAATPIPALAQASDMSLIAKPAELKWGPAPPSLPKGAQISVLAGDPSKDGPFTIRLKMPAGYRIPAHHHPTTENVTVIKGVFHAGMGDKLDEKAAKEFEPGGFASLPANMNHFAWAGGETIVQVHANGPFAIVYVDPEDDPSKAK